MRNRLDKKISQRLRNEAPVMPKVNNSKIDQLLHRVRSEEATCDAEKKSVCTFTYRTALAAAGAALILTTGSYAAVDKYHEHLQSMSHREQQQLNQMTQTQNEDADHYSRKLSVKEQRRKEQLYNEYKKGTLPKKKLREIDKQQDIDVNGSSEVVYCRENSTFYLPENELSDEQLLQLIDFDERRNYALTKQNKEIITQAPQEAVGSKSAQMTKKQLVQLAKQYVNKVYQVATDKVTATVDENTFEDEEGGTVLVFCKWKKRKYEVLLDSKTGELCQIDDTDTYMKPIRNLEDIQKMQTKHIMKLQKIIDELEGETEIVKCKSIYIYDKETEVLGATLKYYVQNSRGSVYMFSYNIDNDNVDGIWVTSDFEGTWKQEVQHRKEQSKTETVQIKYFNCINNLR